jgi:hypothetical protein
MIFLDRLSDLMGDCLGNSLLPLSSLPPPLLLPLTSTSTITSLFLVESANALVHLMAWLWLNLLLILAYFFAGYFLIAHAQQVICDGTDVPLGSFGMELTELTNQTSPRSAFQPNPLALEQRGSQHKNKERDYRECNIIGFQLLSVGWYHRVTEEAERLY